MKRKVPRRIELKGNRFDTCKMQDRISDTARGKATFNFENNLVFLIILEAICKGKLDKILENTCR